jgi:hypothetical protein
VTKITRGHGENHCKASIPLCIFNLEGIPLHGSFVRTLSNKVLGAQMPRKLGPKLILSFTVLIVAISCISGYFNFRTQKERWLRP